MNNVFSQQAEQQVSKSANNETNISQNKRSSRKWRIGKFPLIVSSFLTLALLSIRLTTAVSGGVDALPAAYHVSGKQSIVQSQHIVIPAPITPTSTLHSHRGNVK